MKRELYQKLKAKQFYEDRFENGYMDEWTRESKERIFSVINELDLPPNGRALDYGCGNGVFTEIMREALPQWDIFGCDISEKAIANAKNRFPECTFFVSDNDK